jgi:hypothetical protein
VVLATAGTQESRAAQDFAMSDFSLTLVLQFKTSKIINDMAKVQIICEMTSRLRVKSAKRRPYIWNFRIFLKNIFFFVCLRCISFHTLG